MEHHEIENCVIGAKNGNKKELLRLLNQYKAFIFKAAGQYNIKNAFKSTARQNSRHKAELSLNLLVEPNGNNNTEFIDCINSNENSEENVLLSENISEIKGAVSRLPSHETELIHMNYYSIKSGKLCSKGKGFNSGINC